MTQYVLTEGTPAIALALVVWACARAAGAAGERRVARAILATGLLAAAVSIVQGHLGLYLAGRLIPDRRAGSAVTVFEAVNRLDGVKMFLLAALTLTALRLFRHGRPIVPRPLALYVSPALALSIAISAVGYLFLLNGPALAAWVSLPLLLVWVTGTGLVLGGAR